MRIGIGLPITRRIGGSSAPFSPLNIANLAAWYDAADTATITQSGGNVSQWNDKSGNSRHLTQVTGTRQPLTGTATINSLNAISFDGGDCLTMANTIAAGGAYTIFSVGIPTSFASPRHLIGGVTGSPSFRTDLTNGRLQIVRQQQAVLLTGTTAVSTSVAQAHVFKSLTAGNTVWINGTAVGSNATNPSYTQPISVIGARDNVSTEGWLGSIGDLLIYTADLSASEMNQVGNYLAAKWGFTWTNI